MSEIRERPNKRRGKVAPPRTPEEQEKLMISLSMKQAEEMLRAGKAPPNVLFHFLKLGTEMYKAQLSKTLADAEMASARADYIQTQKEHDRDYAALIAAFKSYGGQSGVLNNAAEDDEGYEGLDLREQNLFRPY